MKEDAFDWQSLNLLFFRLRMKF